MSFVEVLQEYFRGEKQAGLALTIAGIYWSAIEKARSEIAATSP